MDAQERELWIEYQKTGSQQARNSLIEEYLPLLRHLAYKQWENIPVVARSNHTVDDFVSVAVIELVKSIDRFDLDRGNSFSTFAVPRLRGSMLDYLRETDYLPRSLRGKPDPPGLIPLSAFNLYKE